MLADIGPWFLGGALAAGLIAALLPQELLEGGLAKDAWTLPAMLAVSAPLYVCATASTPIAAALMAKGLSPGAALVFLLAGPATNAATMAVASRLLGKRAAAIYVLSIAVCSLGLGFATDLAILTWDHGAPLEFTQNAAETYGAFETGAALALLGLILANLPGRALFGRVLPRWVKVTK